MSSIARIAAGGITILWCLSGAACTPHDAPSAHVNATRDSAGITIVENDPSSADTSSWSIPSAPRARIQAFVAAEEESSRFTNQVTGTTQLPSNLIVIADPGANQLRIFDRAGQFIGSALRGAGLGNLTSIDALFRTASDSLVAADFGKKSYVVLDAGGKSVRELTLVAFAGDSSVPRSSNVSLAGIFADGSLLLSTAADSPESARHDTASASRSSPRIRLLRGDWHGIIHTDYGVFARGLYAVSGSSLYYVDTASVEILVYDATGSLRRIIRTRHDNTPSTQPARFDALRVDPMGNIWVRAYESAGPPPTKRWYVYDSTGVMRHAIADHGPAMPQEVGANYLLGFDRDASGITYVESFPIAKRESAQSPTPAGTP